MVIDGQILLDLLEAGGVDQRGGILLAFDRVLLQAGEQLREAHRSGVRAKDLVHADKDGGVHHTDLQASEIIGSVDGTDGVGGAAGAVVNIAEADEAVAGDPLVDLLAELAVKCVKRTLRVGEQVGHIQNADALIVSRQNGSGGQSHLNGTHCDGFAQLFVATQLSIGEDLDFDAPIGLGLDLVLEDQQSLMGGTILGLNVADLENDLLSGGICLGIAIAAGGVGLAAAGSQGQDHSECKDQR